MLRQGKYAGGALQIGPGGACAHDTVMPLVDGKTTPSSVLLCKHLLHVQPTWQRHHPCVSVRTQPTASQLPSSVMHCALQCRTQTSARAMCQVAAYHALQHDHHGGGCHGKLWAAHVSRWILTLCGRARLSTSSLNYITLERFAQSKYLPYTDPTPEPVFLHMHMMISTEANTVDASSDQKI